jgi:hypothetical protein
MNAARSVSSSIASPRHLVNSSGLLVVLCALAQKILDIGPMYWASSRSICASTDGATLGGGEADAVGRDVATGRWLGCVTRGVDVGEVTTGLPTGAAAA